jgi:hypothetical protein
MSDLSGAADPRAGFGQARSFAGPHLQSRAATAFRVLFGIFIFFLILELVTRLELVPPIYLPRASTVVRRIVELLQDPKFLSHVVATLHAWAVGLALATLISVPIGILIIQNDLTADRIHTADSFGRPNPAWNSVVGAGILHEGHSGRLCGHVANLV